MLKVALRHFLNPCCLDVGSVIVAFDAHSSALCQAVGECGEQNTISQETSEPRGCSPLSGCNPGSGFSPT